MWRAYRRLGSGELSEYHPRIESSDLYKGISTKTTKLCGDFFVQDPKLMKICFLGGMFFRWCFVFTNWDTMGFITESSETAPFGTSSPRILSNSDHGDRFHPPSGSAWIGPPNGRTPWDDPPSGPLRFIPQVVVAWRWMNSFMVAYVSVVVPEQWTWPRSFKIKGFSLAWGMWGFVGLLFV